MDGSLYRWINRRADRTGWTHGLFEANAGYGIALFAILLLVAYHRRRSRMVHHRRAPLPVGELARRTGIDTTVGVDAVARLALPARNRPPVPLRSVAGQRPSTRTVGA